MKTGLRRQLTFNSFTTRLYDIQLKNYACMHALQGTQYVSKYNWYKPFKCGIETKKIDNTPFGQKASRSNELQI